MATIRHVLTILAVEDLASSVQFYRSAFGWDQVVDVPVYAEFVLSGGQRIGLYVRAGFARSVNQMPIPIPAGAITPSELYFHTDDIEGVVMRLKEAGARELSPLSKRDWGDDAAYFADLDGNIIVIAQPSS